MLKHSDSSHRISWPNKSYHEISLRTNEQKRDANIRNTNTYTHTTSSIARYMHLSPAAPMRSSATDSQEVKHNTARYHHCRRGALTSTRSTWHASAGCAANILRAYKQTHKHTENAHYNTATQNHTERDRTCPRWLECRPRQQTASQGAPRARRPVSSNCKAAASTRGDVSLAAPIISKVRDQKRTK